jgi:hypothetical protein
VSFFIHVSRLYRQTKWPALLKIIASLGSAQWSDFLQAERISQREIHQVIECLRPESFQPNGSDCVV